MRRSRSGRLTRVLLLRFDGVSALNADYGWICYGPTLTVIPYIIDLKDTKGPSRDKRAIWAMGIW